MNIKYAGKSEFFSEIGGFTGFPEVNKEIRYQIMHAILEYESRTYLKSLIL